MNVDSDAELLNDDKNEVDGDGDAECVALIVTVMVEEKVVVVPWLYVAEEVKLSTEPETTIVGEGRDKEKESVAVPV